MSARNDILARIRLGRRTPPELPDPAALGTPSPHPAEKFSEMLQLVGGRCVRADSLAAAAADLQQLEAYSTARKTVSCVPGLGATTFDLAAVDDPHVLEDVDFAVLPGELAVAENAAVWVTDEHVSHRVLYFLPQHLALVVPTDRLVHTMHDAYRQVDVARRAFGCWVSGPSKTADIEQSLVIGAHGARSLTVYLVAGWP